ncbi:unnamed protein product [Trichobilharzia szidati]|nr:unnamed protein product [Trichobilharzia szidati]
MSAGVRTTELAAILCATFENVQGTVIAYQYPPNYVSPTQFKEIGNAVIPRAELAFRLVTIEAFKHYVIGCLQRIEGVQYKRNTLQFNICLVIKPKSTPDRDDISHWQFWDDQSAGGLRPNVQAAYEALTLKINRYFYSLEEQCAFLSRALGHHDGAVNSVKLTCLDSIYKQLHESGMCIISFPNCGSLYLRFSPRQDRGSYSNLSFDTSELVHEQITNSDTELKFDQKIRQINLHYNNQLVFPNFNPQTESEVTDDCVFVVIASPSYKCHSKLGYNMSGGWRPLDAVAQRILPYIDGKRRLMELAHLAQLDVTIARLCLIDLARIGVVRSLPYPTFLVPSSQVERFSNMNLIPGWLGLPRLATLLTDYNLSRICLETVVSHNHHHHPRKPYGLCIHDIFRLYTVLCASSNFSLPYLISANPHIRFTEYPNCMNSSSSSSSYYSLPPIQPLKFCPCYTFQFHKRHHHRHCSKISLLSLVQFGEVNGLIRRIQCYPISDKLALPDEQTSNNRLLSVASLSSKESSAAATSAVIITPNSTMNSTHQQIALRQIKTHSNSLRHNPSKFSKKPKIINEQMWSTAKSMLMDGQHSLDSIITFMVINNDSLVESPPTVHKIPEHITEISQLYRFDECLGGQMPHSDHDISQINRSKLSNSFSFSPDDTIVNNNSQIVEEMIAHDRISDNRLWSRPEDCMTAFMGPLDLDKTHLTLPDLYWMWR